MIRRILPFIVLGLGFFAIGLFGMEKELHSRPRVQSPSFDPETTTSATFPKYCPKYRMLQMGGLYLYYTLVYDTNCNSSYPVAYDTSNGSLQTGCNCDPDTCCFAAPVAFTRVLRNDSAADHIVDNNLKTHHTQRGINSDDPMEMHGKLDKFTNVTLEFKAAVDDGAGGVWWVKLGQFHSDDGSQHIDSYIGYEVAVDPIGSPDVPQTATVATAISGFDHIVTVSIKYAPDDPNARFNGEYQVVRADD